MKYILTVMMMLISTMSFATTWNVQHTAHWNDPVNYNWIERVTFLVTNVETGEEYDNEITFTEDMNPDTIDGFSWEEQDWNALETVVDQLEDGDRVTYNTDWVEAEIRIDAETITITTVMQNGMEVTVDPVTVIIDLSVEPQPEPKQQVKGPKYKGDLRGAGIGGEWDISVDLSDRLNVTTSGRYEDGEGIMGSRILFTYKLMEW